MTTDSSLVEEVRRRAMEISARFDHDVRKYGEHLRRRQREPQYRDRVVSQITVIAAHDSAPSSAARAPGKP